MLGNINRIIAFLQYHHCIHDKIEFKRGSSFSKVSDLAMIELARNISPDMKFNVCMLFINLG